MANNNKILQEFHIDLALWWQDAEGLTLNQINERLVAYFGEEVKTSDSALSQRMTRRRKDFASGVKPTRAIPNPDELTDEALLSWFGSLMYEEIYIAKAKSDSNSLRKNIDMSLKVMRTKKDLTGTTTEEEDAFTKEFRTLLKKERNAEA